MFVKEHLARLMQSFEDWEVQKSGSREGSIRLPMSRTLGGAAMFEGGDKVSVDEEESMIGGLT
jgi:hypothetical protein